MIEFKLQRILLENGVPALSVAEFNNGYSHIISDDQKTY